MEPASQPDGRGSSDGARPTIDPVDAAWLHRRSSSGPLVLGVLGLLTAPILLGLLFASLGLSACGGKAVDDASNAEVALNETMEPVLNEPVEALPVANEAVANATKDVVADAADNAKDAAKAAAEAAAKHM